MSQPNPEYSGKSLAYADYQPWGYEYKRINTILEALTMGFMRLRYEPLSCMALLDAIKELYRPLRPVMIKPVRERFDKEFAIVRKIVKAEMARLELEKDVSGELIISEKVYEQMDKLCDRLYDIRHVLGMGVSTTKQTSRKAALKRSMGGK